MPSPDRPADPLTLDAAGLARAYRHGTLSPVDVVQASLARLDVVDARCNLFAHVDREGALSAARDSAARHAAGAPLGPFDGVPVTIKDNIDVAGMPTAWGSALFEDNMPAADDIPVARLRAGGAIVLGKTCVAEFTLGNGNVNTPRFGVTRNPHDPTRTTGASTGGGAGATTAGIGVIALGTDGGGSIRRPAGYANLVGLKPTMGRVARLGDLPPLLHDYEVIGPLGRSVADVAACLRLIEGPDPRDRLSLAARVFTPKRAGSRLRLLAVPQILHHKVDPEISAAFAEVTARFGALGLEVTTGDLPVSLGEFEANWPLLGASALAWMLRGRDWQGRIGPQYPPMVERGNAIAATDLYGSLVFYRRLYAEFVALFETVDAVITPTAGAMPWRAEDTGPSHHRAFTGFVNAAGLPAVALPAPVADGDLPIGFQIIGPFGSDHWLLDLAARYESAFPFISNRPPV